MTWATLGVVATAEFFWRQRCRSNRNIIVYERRSADFSPNRFIVAGEDDRCARPRQQEAGSVLVALIQVRHEGHQSRSARSLGRKGGSCLPALRLFRPR